MNLTFYFRGGDGKKEFSSMYSFEEETLTRLKGDFESYCKDSTLIKGGWYECKHKEDSRVVFLKFDEILYMG